MLQKPFHLPADFRRIGGIQLAVVPHHRVHHHPGKGFLEPLHELLHDIYLLHGAQEAGTDTVKLQPVHRPVFHIRAHPVSIIVNIMLGKPRVHGQNRRRQRACLNLHGRNQRQLHRDGATAKACHIIYQRNALLSFHRHIIHILNHRLIHSHSHRHKIFSPCHFSCHFPCHLPCHLPCYLPPKH